MDEKLTVTQAQFTKAIVEVVLERGPDYVYPRTPDTYSEDKGCRYVLKDGKPGCIIGATLMKLGVDTEELIRFEGLNANTAIENTTTLPYQIQQAARLGQCQQDRGENWGAALLEYLRHV